MGALELRSNLHKIIDSIQNEQLLKTLYDFLKARDNDANDMWSDLSEAQRQHVLDAFEESKKEQDLISRDKFFKRPE